MKYLSQSLIIVFMLASASWADDWPCWRGPNRDDINRETGLMQTWPEGGPQRVWLSREGGLGYAGFSVVGDQLFTMGLEDETEFALCLDANSGEVIWKTPVAERFENNWGDGPRSTPSVDGDFVYLLTARGTLACLNRESGNIVWKRTMDEFGGEIPNWGYAESVLVDGNRVVCTPGGGEGTLVALNKLTGELIWQTKDFTEPAHYSSIIKINHAYQSQYVQLTPEALVGVDPDTGDVLWQSEWRGRTAVIPTPIYHDGMVYVSSGYGAGCKQIRLSDTNEVEEVFSNNVMNNHHGGVIFYAGDFYGHSDRAGWTCQDGETGERVWNNRKDLGKGAIAYADGCFYCLDESSGDVVLIKASSDEWQELGRFTLDPQTEQRKPQGRIWVHPVIANGKLYLRDQELIYCYDIKAK